MYDVTNLSINQTLSRTVITSGLVFLSVVSLVLLGGETLRPFSLALLMGIMFGTYDTIAVAGPIMVWWERRIEAANRSAATKPRDSAGFAEPQRGDIQIASARASESHRAPLEREQNQFVSGSNTACFAGCASARRGTKWIVFSSGFVLDFASNCGIDCDRCWPIKYARYGALASWK